MSTTSCITQMQGVVERMKIIVSETRRCPIIESGSRDWKQLLSAVKMTIISSKNFSTEYSSLLLMLFILNPLQELLAGDESLFVKSA